MATEEQVKEINKSLQTVSDELKTFAEQSQKEIKNHATMSAETKAKVDELLTKQGELNARLQAAEQTLVNADNRGKEKVMSLGDRVIANHEQIKAFAGKRGSIAFDLKAAITNDTMTDMAVPYRVPGVQEKGRQRLRIRDLLMWGKCNSSSVEFWRETTFTNNADAVSENPELGKPVSVIEGSLQSAPVATIAHRIKASNQILSDVAMLKSYIDGKMAYGVLLTEEEQLLKGSGVGLNINGLYTQAASYSQPSGVDVDTETRIDRLRLAMLQAELADYYADGIVLSLQDWTSIQLQKNADKVYLLGTAQGILTPTLWGLPVVGTKSMDAGDFLVGAFGSGAQAWDRESMTVALSTEDGDNFSNNMVTIQAKERIALTVYQTAAFVKGDFDGLAT